MANEAAEGTMGREETVVNEDEITAIVARGIAAAFGYCTRRGVDGRNRNEGGKQAVFGGASGVLA